MDQPTHTTTIRPSEQLLLDVLPELPAGRALTNTAGRAQFAAAYARLHATSPVTTWYLDLFQCEQTKAQLVDAPGNLQLLCEADFPATEFDLVALALHKQGDGELTRDLLQQAQQRLVLGGRFVAAIDHPDDSWLHDQLHKLYDKVTRRPAKTGVVYLATKKSELKKVKHYDCELTFRDGERELQALTRPGVFSHREIDGGAKALLAIMEIDPGQRVLDLGCGSGAVALAAAARGERVRVHAVDSNPRAVQCVKWGAAKNELPLITSALDCDGRSVKPNSFDLVLANPPYFSNFRLAELFVQIAKRALVPDGYLILVTKTPKWYENHLPDQDFYEIYVHASHGYRVVTAMRG